MAAGSGAGQALILATQRVYFALWPDAGVRAALAQAARSMHRVMHGRQARDESLHLTLAFIGYTDVENLPRLMAPPAGVFTPAFLLTLDDWGCWARYVNEGPSSVEQAVVAPKLPPSCAGKSGGNAHSARPPGYLVKLRQSRNTTEQPEHCHDSVSTRSPRRFVTCT
jgi:hypothetical protein